MCSIAEQPAKRSRPVENDRDVVLTVARRRCGLHREKTPIDRRNVVLVAASAFWRLLKVEELFRRTDCHVRRQRDETAIIEPSAVT